MTKRGVAVDLEALRRELQAAKENERPSRMPSLREAVGVLLPEIEGLRRAKWSDAQVAEWLGKRGLEISPGTLAQYVREARKVASATDSEPKAKRTSKLPANDEPKIPANGSAAKIESKPDTAPKPAKASAATETMKTSETVSPSPATRTPNAAAAIPAGKRRVQDDA